MCGRYTLVEPERLSERFEASPTTVTLSPRYNIAPGQTNPVITRNSPNGIELMEWGFVPVWAKDKPFTMINIRMETLRDKRTFSKMLLTQRCIVPASGFYEWQRNEKGKQPYYFKLNNDTLFGMAGLYTENEDGNQYAIITTTPNKMLAPIHDRMPVILHKEDENEWLGETAEHVLVSLLKPFEETQMESYPVEKRVNTTSNDSPELVIRKTDKN